MTFVVRLLVNAAALWVATCIVPGVTYTGDVMPFLAVALVFGAINGFIRPVATFVTFPVIILTLGVFFLVVNGLMLWLTSAISDALGLGFHVRGFWSAFFGALVVSVVSTILSLMVREPHKAIDDAH